MRYVPDPSQSLRLKAIPILTLMTLSSDESNTDSKSVTLEEGDEVKFNARVPESLRDAFQEVCSTEGRSMSWVVRRWMLRAVEKGETGL